MSANRLKFYIGGAWVEPVHPATLEVINPTTEESFATVSSGSEADVDRAVAAASAASESYANTTKAERIALFQAIIASYRPRVDEIAETITAEMGAPAEFSRAFHALWPINILTNTSALLEHYDFDQRLGSTLVTREPIGVCGLITPWNAPVASVMTKTITALAAGCTVVVKPSEIAPLSPLIFAEIMHSAGVPPGVFNLVNGTGATVGQRIAAHPDVRMVSFTGSTRAGVLVAKAAADSVKRVHQELGGKSANIILPDADIEKVASAGLQRCYVGGGQSCQAPTRMLVHRSQQERAVNAAKQAAEAYKVGDPRAPGITLGPLASGAQFDKAQRLIAAGIAQKARLVTGGLGRPEGLKRGFFVRPTVFANVGRRFTIAQEEVFGPVLSILPYDSEEEAIAIANDTEYGLAGWVYSGDLDRARKVARRLRTGRVYLNGAPPDPAAPFGGYKQSGNGRENGTFGLEEFLEVKALLGSEPVAA